MQDFITSVTAKLGISEDSARSASGGLLQVIQDCADGETFQTLLSKLPGGADLLQSARAQSPSAGMLGGLMSKASSALSTEAGSSVDLAKVFSSIDFDTAKVVPFVTDFLGFIRSKVGDDTLNRVLDKAPGLAQLSKND